MSTIGQGAKLGWWARWRLRREADACLYRAARLRQWGDPEAAQDQLDRVVAIRCAYCEDKDILVSGPHSHVCSKCGGKAFYGWYTTPLCRLDCCGAIIDRVKEE